MNRPRSTIKPRRLAIKWRVTLLLLLLLPLAIWLANRLWPLVLQEVPAARIVVAEDGSPLWRFADSEGIWRYLVKLDEVSPYYIEALLTYEDRWFYQHRGVNPLALGRALWQNLSNNRIVSGGSTLSMQVARLIEPHERTYSGKLRQLWRTLQLEWYLSKDEILTLYLNRAPYGGTLQGIGAASWAYLGKSPAQLTQAEAALMAVLPQAPSRLRPDRYPARAKQARDKVLDRLAAYGVWPAETVADIRQETIFLASRQPPQLAPLLARRLTNWQSDTVIQSTIDIALQRRLEELASGWRSQLPAKNSVAILVVDHTNMAVKAYLGSIDFNDDSRFGHVDMINALRSPGSTLKPFVYAMALDDGLIHSESLLQDVPRRFGDYRPGNFDSGFHGPVSAAESLVRSLNLPSVQLLEAYGPKRFTANLRNTGVLLNFPLNSEPNLSLILGGTGIQMDQLVAAYSAFARGGKVAGLRYTVDQPLVERPLLSAGSAWIVRRILAGESRPQTDNNLTAIAPLAWKTGTSYGYRDAWAIGITPRYLIGIWVGRPDSTPVAGQFGYVTAVPFLHQVNTLLSAQERIGASGVERVIPRDPRPDSVSWQSICWPQGQPLPDGDVNCRQRRQAWILDHTTPPTLANPGQDSAMGGWLTYWVNSQGKRVAGDCPAAIEQRLALWPIALESWLPLEERRNSRLPKSTTDCAPLGFDNLSPLLILGLQDNSILRAVPGKSALELWPMAQGGFGKRWWFLNAELVGKTGGLEPLAVTLSTRGKYQLVVMDESGQINRVAFNFD